MVRGVLSGTALTPELISLMTMIGTCRRGRLVPSAMGVQNFECSTTNDLSISFPVPNSGGKFCSIDRLFHVKHSARFRFT